MKFHKNKIDGNKNNNNIDNNNRVERIGKQKQTKEYVHRYTYIQEKIHFHWTDPRHKNKTTEMYTIVDTRQYGTRKYTLIEI